MRDNIFMRIEKYLYLNKGKIFRKYSLEVQCRFVQFFFLGIQKRFSRTVPSQLSQETL